MCLVTNFVVKIILNTCLSFILGLKVIHVLLLQYYIILCLSLFLSLLVRIIFLYNLVLFSILLFQLEKLPLALFFFHNTTYSALEMYTLLVNLSRASSYFFSNDSIVWCTVIYSTSSLLNRPVGSKVLFYLFIIFHRTDSPLLCEGFLRLRGAGSTLQLWCMGFYCDGVSRCGAQALGCTGFRSCGPWA